MRKPEQKIVSLAEFFERRVQMEKGNKKYVFTNGCFDILHRGHIEYLNKARELGDFLIVGLNSDISVKKLKGDRRPVVDEKSRAIVLAALECVDAVILFDEETPLQMIIAINPDILVKGADYKEHEIVGASEVLERGGDVKTIELVDGFSTSELIEKIRKL